MLIIALTGTLGAGKGTVVEYLKAKGFAHYSAREFLLKEVERRGLPKNRDSLREVGESLRAQGGGSFVVDSLYDEAKEAGQNAIIESVRAMGEVESLKKKGALLIGVDADPKVRYERVVIRGSETDKISFEKFLEDERRESEGDDPARMNLVRCLEAADHIVRNDGTLDELHRQVDDIFATVGRP